MKLPNSAHTSRLWRIHEIAPDFRLYDVWALPTPGGPDDFPRLVQQFAVGDTADNPSWFARTLFAIRWKLGALLGWDDPDFGVGSRMTDAARAVADRSTLRSGRAPVRLSPLHVGLPDGQRVGSGDRQPDGARSAASRLGSRRRGRISRPDGRSGEAERSVREGIYGRDRTVSAPDRLPASDPRHRTGVAGWRRASPIRSQAIFAATGDRFSAQGRK